MIHTMNQRVVKLPYAIKYSYINARSWINVTWRVMLWFKFWWL